VHTRQQTITLISGLKCRSRLTYFKYGFNKSINSTNN